MDKGAHFFKCDFQVHTPRDLNWEGARAETDAERKAFAEEFIAACRLKGLQAVAITDHHDTALFKYIKAAALAEVDGGGKPLAEGARIVVLPGMELTLGIPCQALILFDADFPVDFLEQAAQALTISPAPAASAKHAAIKRLDHIIDFEGLYYELNQRDFLKGRFFVMPHVGESGNFSLLRKGFAAKYKSMPCVGGFLDGSTAQHGDGNAAIVAGKNKEWGNKAIGVFQTSDNRRRDFASLGNHTTWVKWARPTAEALRQACLARESRLAQSEPAIPSVHITSIEVSNSSFLGPIVLELNPQYNALIGGRGTGKSTILEYLRWGLCDQPSSDEDDEAADIQRRRRSLVANTLESVNATVTVSFVKNAIPHVVRRKSGTNEVVLRIGDAEFAPCTEADIRALLPVHAFSQKQLSSVGEKVDELDRFVHAAIKNELAHLDATRNEMRGKLKATYEDLSRHRIVAGEIAKLELERKSLAEQIDSLRKSLKGLSDEDRQIIAGEVLYEKEEQLVRAWEAELARAELALREIDSELAGTPTNVPAGDTPDLDLLKNMYNSLEAWFASTREALASRLGALDGNATGYALGSYQAALDQWRTRRHESEGAYAAAKTRSAAQEGTLTQISEIELRLKGLDATLAEKRRTVQKLGDPAGRFAEQRKQWVALQRQSSDLIEGQCKELTELSKGLIAARLLRGHRVEALDQRLRGGLKGSKVRAERYERLWQRVTGAADPVAEWNNILDELDLLAQTVIEDDKSSLPNTPLLESLEFTLRDRQAIARALSADAWIGLLLVDLQDLVDFEYRTREGEFIKFKVASAGQQATALTYVLLNQTGPPLVIDQPEDDLDNKVMDEIVREIWAAKARRQIVFASHNANLVVNGDAELVVCCDYRIAGDQSGGKIKLEGAIDIPEINTEITAVMEGGREAFALRQAKYGF